MSEQQSSEAKSTNAPRRWMRWLLVASLGVNLLILGAVSGAILSGDGPNRRGGPPGERSVSAPYVGAFTREDKRALRTTMRAQLPKREDVMQANVRDHAAFLTILRASEFDRAQAAQIMESQMNRVSATMRLGRQIALDRIAGMSVQERMDYADRLEMQAPRSKNGKN